VRKTPKNFCPSTYINEVSVKTFAYPTKKSATAQVETFYQPKTIIIRLQEFSFLQFIDQTAVFGHPSFSGLQCGGIQHLPMLNCKFSTPEKV